MFGLVISVAGMFVAATLAFVTNWLALIPWRRARDQHWTERARLYYPIRAGAASNLWRIPAILTIGALLLLPDSSPHWMITAAAASLGVSLGTLPFDREVFARISWSSLFRDTAMVWLMRFLMWFVFLACAALMPSQINLLTLLITLAFIVIGIYWNYAGWIHACEKLRIFLPPPDRLQRIVRDTSVRMNVRVEEVFFMFGSLAQAYAVPGRRRLLFTARLVEVLTDDEIASVTAHELAHLTEGRGACFMRHVSWLSFLPWIFIRPVLANLGTLGILILLPLPALVTPIARAAAIKLEVRADKIAHANEPEPGIYARALLKIYEDGLMPAVNPKGQTAHPHLYNRLVAAGVTPDFPRPAPAGAMAWNGLLFYFLLMLMVMIWAIWFTGTN